MKTDEKKPATCGSCPAFVAADGRCHATPPVVYRFHTESVYPPVKADTDWCMLHPERTVKPVKKPKA